MNFGLERHFKNPIDSFFGLETHWRKQLSFKEIVSGVRDVVRAFRAGSATNTADATCWLLDFVPPPKWSVELWTLVPSSLACNLTDCHSWTIAFQDQRRRSLGARAAGSDVLTGVKVRAHMLPGIRAPEHMSGFPRVQEKVFAADPPLDPSELNKFSDVVSNDDFPIDCQEFRGWRCSFRQELPEQTPASSYNSRLAKKQRAFEPISHQIPTVLRRLPLEARLQRAEAQAKSRSERRRLDAAV